MLLSLIALFYFLFGLILQIFNGQKCQQWSFGYGSNMDVTHMRLRKELNVYGIFKKIFTFPNLYNLINLPPDYKPGILKNYQMLFNLKSSSINRPATGGLIYNFQHETHGLLFCLDLQSMEKLHRWERGYTRKLVSIEGYDGKVTDNVLVYTTPEVSLSRDFEGLDKKILIQKVELWIFFHSWKNTTNQFFSSNFQCSKITIL